MSTKLRTQRIAQRGKLHRIERLAAHARIEAAGGDRRGGARLVAAGNTGRERIDERLAALAERRAHDGEQQRFILHVRRRCAAHTQPHDGARDLRRGDKAVRRHVEEQLRLGVPLDEHGQRAVIRRAGPGAQAARDLALDHDGDGVEAAGGEKRREQRRRDVIRQVRAHDGAQAGEALGHQLRQVEREHVAKDELHVFIPRERLGQHGAQALVELDGDDLPGALRELLGQAADTRADLEHAGARVRAGGVGNVGRHPRGGEKVLPQGLGKAEIMPREQRADVREICQIHTQALTSAAFQTPDGAGRAPAHRRGCCRRSGSRGARGAFSARRCAGACPRARHVRRFHARAARPPA